MGAGEPGLRPARRAEIMASMAGSDTPNRPSSIIARLRTKGARCRVSAMTSLKISGTPLFAAFFFCLYSMLCTVEVPVSVITTTNKVKATPTHSSAVTIVGLVKPLVKSTLG